MQTEPDSLSLASRAARFARRPVVADLAVTLGGRWTQMFIALAGSILSARALGPEEFGRFGMVMAVIMICGTFADAGLTYTAVKMIAERVTPGDGSALSTARTYFLLRLCTGVLVAALGVTLSAPIAAGVLGYPDLTPYLQLAFLTVAALSVSGYPGTVLVGLMQFGRLSAAGVLNALITLAGIAALFLAGQLNLGTLVAWNVILPLISTIPAWFLIPREWLPWRGQSGINLPRLDRGMAREMLGFGKWVAISTLGTMIALQGDLILLGRFSSPEVVGVYSVALALALRLDTLNQSLLTVLLPRASRLRGAADIRQYTRRVLPGSIALAAALGLVAFLAQPLIRLLYGVEYTASAGLFLALTLVVLFDLVTSSLFLVAFPLNKPRVLAVADWLRVGVLGLVGWSLIPAFGGFGAVMARGAARLVGTIYTLVALSRATSAAGDQEDAEAGAVSEITL